MQKLSTVALRFKGIVRLGIITNEDATNNTNNEHRIDQNQHSPIRLNLQPTNDRLFLPVLLQGMACGVAGPDKFECQDLMGDITKKAQVEAPGFEWKTYHLVSINQIAAMMD